MIRFTWLLLVLCLAWSSHAQQREQRVALVIGNGAYQSSPLKNPVNDATDMAQALKDKGFAVTLRTNIGNRDMRQAIRAFSQTLKAGGVGLFYFAGHGVQSKGRNYLIPLNAEIKEEFELEDEAFDANRVLAGMEEAGNRVNIVILDACRDNPFGRAWRTSATGLAQLSAPIGSFVAFATAPGSVAADGSGRNGLFTSHLLTSLRNPDSDIDRVFTRVAAAVARESGNKQVPWKSSSLTGEFRFAIADQPVPLVAQSPAAPAAVSAEQEERFWEDAKAAGNQEAYEAYLESYPKGRYASLARANLARLNAAKAAAQKLATDAAAERANKAEQDRRAAEEAQKAVQRAASERVAAEAAAKEQQRLAMEAQAKEQARLALLAQEQARVAAEAAQRLAAARMAELPQPGQTIKDCADCPEMVVLPGGSFLMGSPPDPQPDPFIDEKPKPPIGTRYEKPQHRVQIQSFAIGKYEVTQEQWYAVMGANPSYNKGRTLPVEAVGWEQAQVFIQKLNQKTGQQYRLPSEAEWEYAARAGSQAEYSFGDDEKELGRYAWYGVGGEKGKTHPVGEKQANRFGLHDMHGNVWEWVQDCWHDNYNGAPTDGSAWTTGCKDNNTYQRTARGGSWANGPSVLRSAIRVQFTAWPGYYINADGIGLRLARTLFTP